MERGAIPSRDKYNFDETSKDNKIQPPLPINPGLFVSIGQPPPVQQLSKMPIDL